MPGLPETADPFEGMTTVERIHAQILHRRKDGIEEQIDLALRDLDPVTVLNTVLLPAMKDVGDRFGAGELILPFVLQSAEVMKRAVAHLEQYLEKREGYTKGKVVLATVYGDVHDIGKNLVNTILSNNGYTVFDLGKQVPLNTILDKAQEVDADAIGLSALLVSTSKQMPACVKELDERGLTYPLIIGGAAINRGFGRRILYLDEQRAYDPASSTARTPSRVWRPSISCSTRNVTTRCSSRVLDEARVHREREAEKLERRNAAAAGAAAMPARSSRAPRRPDTRRAVLGRARAPQHPDLGRVPAHRPQLPLQDELAVPRRAGPGEVGRAAAQRARAAPAAFDGRGGARRLAAAGRRLRILAGARRRQHGDRLRPRRHRRRARALHVPAPERAAPAVPRRLRPSCRGRGRR